jgi:hypothetical protein
MNLVGGIGSTRGDFLEEDSALGSFIKPSPIIGFS